MRFDNTEGKNPKYMVTVYGWSIEDHYYYAEYRRALNMFKKLRDSVPGGTSVSLYDMVKDVRKEYARA